MSNNAPQHQDDVPTKPNEDAVVVPNTSTTSEQQNSTTAKPQQEEPKKMGQADKQTMPETATAANNLSVEVPPLVTTDKQNNKSITFAIPHVESNANMDEMDDSAKILEDMIGVDPNTFQSKMDIHKSSSHKYIPKAKTNISDVLHLVRI